MHWLDMAYIAAMTLAAGGVAAMLIYSVALLRLARPDAGAPTLPQPWRWSDVVRAAVFYAGALGLAEMSVRLLAPKSMPAAAEDVAGLLAFTFAHVLVCLYVVLLGESERGKRAADIGLSIDDAVHRVVLGVLYYAAFCPVLAGSIFAVNKMAQIAQRGGEHLSPQRVVDMISQETSVGLLATVTALVVVAAPITEEILFRGFLFSALRDQFGARRAIVLSAAVFSLIHGSLIATIPLFLLGLLLAWAFHRTRTLAAPIAIHMTHNTVTIFLLLRSRL